jgi:subtilisin family serine protease
MADDVIWRLKPVEKDVPYDPHLEHHELAEKEKRPDPAIRSRGNDNRIYVDMIAKLNESEIPKEIVDGRPLDGTNIITGKIALTDIGKVRPQVSSLKAATEVYLDLFHSLPGTRCDSASLLQGNFPSLDGSGVIIGVVDVGCDFAHPNFLKPCGETRLLSLWDQSDPPPRSTGKSPENFYYGREFTAEQINEALTQKDKSAYAALGYTPGIAAHGTHVLDIAAGNGRGDNQPGGQPLPGLLVEGADRAPRGVAPGADLIFVHLKSNESQFLGNSRHLLDAVDYIFRKAGNRPVVVNLSISTTGGPHDGTTLVEQGLVRMLANKPGRAIVVSAGNSFNRAVHAQGTVKGEAWEELRWTVDPRGAKNEMEIWYRGESPLAVVLVPPDIDEVPGMALPPVRPGKTYALQLGDEIWGRISHRRDDPNNNAHQIDIRLSSPPGRELELTGTWTIRLQTDPGAQVPFDAWIEQDDQADGRFETLTNNSCTLSSICCAEKLLTVGAFDTSRYADLGRPYDFTAAGPTRNFDFPKKPDVSAPGVDILAARAHGGTAVMSGTSMAAPHLTGLVALLFQHAQETGRGPLSIDTTRRLIIDSIRNASESKPWDPRLGWGPIDGVAALNLLDEIESAGPESIQERPCSSSELKRHIQQLESKLQQLKARLDAQEVRPEALVTPSVNGGNGARRKNGTKLVHPEVLNAGKKKAAKGRSKEGRL